MKKTVILFVLFSLLFTLPAGADINSALLVAVSNGNSARVKELLEKGADVNAKDQNGTTALTIATGYGYTEIIELLKKAGAKGDERLQGPATAEPYFTPGGEYFSQG